ncbi:thiamine diphosphokinase [Virgibacillus kimchii]
MLSVGIIGSAPDSLKDFSLYKEKVDIWIGADRGALTLIDRGIRPDYAVGDFDSINNTEKRRIKEFAAAMEEYPSEKAETDLEIALLKAMELRADRIYLFGVTGGRLDHELSNIQLLYSIITKGIRGMIVNENNFLELTLPGEHQISQDIHYPYISFIPFSHGVEGLTLKGFYYPLKNQDIYWGSTLCISNKLIKKNGTFSFNEGILLLIKSRDEI